jgi:uncharacterized protein YegP (UPF0339 family)
MTTNPKHKPGIHLHKTTGGFSASSPDRKPQYYWNIVASNGRILCHSETFIRKGNAVKSMKAAARVFHNTKMYYDHSKPNLEPQSYL